MSRNPPEKDYDASGEPSGILYFFVLNLLRILTVIVLGARVKMDPALKQLKGPIIALGNHPSFLDPVFMGMACWPRRVHFLTSNTFFRHSLLRHILQGLKAIPKVQFRSDVQALKHMLRIIKKNGIIGIYPEGQRSLDGSLQPIDDAIGKFVKKTGCSVVVVLTSGAYLSWPRWSASWLRICRIEVTARILLRPEQIKILDASAIQQHIHQALYYNDYAWQLQKKRKVYSIAPASGLYNLCHKCPACNHDLSMRSHRVKMVCRKCGFILQMDRYGFLHSAQDEMIQTISLDLPTTPYAWHQWQVAELKSQWAAQAFSIRQSARVQLVDPADGSVHVLGHGLICLDSQGFFFSNGTGQKPEWLKFPVLNKTGFSADFGRQFEIVLADKVYRVLLDNGQAVILLADAIRAIQILNSETAAEKDVVIFADAESSES